MGSWVTCVLSRTYTPMSTVSLSKPADEDLVLEAPEYPIPKEASPLTPLVPLPPLRAINFPIPSSWTRHGQPHSMLSGLLPSLFSPGSSFLPIIRFLAPGLQIADGRSHACTWLGLWTIVEGHVPLVLCRGLRQVPAVPQFVVVVPHPSIAYVTSFGAPHTVGKESRRRLSRSKRRRLPLDNPGHRPTAEVASRSWHRSSSLP